MKRKQNKRWGHRLPMSGEDAKRLVLDAVERLGADGRGRSEIIKLMKRVVELGVAAVAAEESTESFERVAWEARQGRRASTLRDLRHYVRRMLRVPGVGSRPPACHDHERVPESSPQCVWAKYAQLPQSTRYLA